VPFTVAWPDLDVFELKGKFLAEIVYNTENFSNFVKGKYTHDASLFY
jgi:hypothetical protein